MLAVALVLWLLEGSFFPRVENPWPHTIGLGFPVATGGAGGVLAGLAFANAKSEKRDLAIKWGGVIGFLAGSLLYGVSLPAQVVSNL
jgi:hypothetical protein